ncbi:MAG: alpha/beta hydrolase family protein [Gemmatimonadales bacterium]
MAPAASGGHFSAMATPHLTKTTILGQLGEILIDIRTGHSRASVPAVLIGHGFKGFKDWGMFPPFAERLARAGFTAISFNLSGSGVDDAGRFSYPDRFGHNSFSREVADVRAVLTALDGGQLGVPRPSSVGMVGHSRGGGIATLVAAGNERIAALVTWAAIATVHRWNEADRQTWRERGRHDVVNTRTGQVMPVYLDLLDDVTANADSLSIEAASARVRAPWLIVHGDADETVPIAEANRLAAANPAAERMVVVGAGHTFGAVHPFAGSTPAMEQVFDGSVRFLSRHLS